MKEKLFIFDRYDNLLAITNNYIEALLEETVEKPVSFTITFPMSDEDASYLMGGNQIAFRDLKGNFRLFTIREVDDKDGESTEKTIECLLGIQELTDVIVKEGKIQKKPAVDALEFILKNSRWIAGNVVDLGDNSINFHYHNAYESLGNLIGIWGGEIVDRIEIEDNKLIGRYIDIVYRKGSDSGKRFEIDKDIKNITRTVLYYPKTALFGKGGSIQTEEGNESKQVSFRDVVWSKDNGDPVDKKLGQEWVGDAEALNKHGIPNLKTGKMMHRFGIFEDNDETDSQILLEKTWRALQAEKETQVQYEMDIITFYQISSYEHEQVFLGDSGIARDKNVKPMILIEARIMSWKYDIGNPNNGSIVLGNILDLNPDNTEINWVIDKVKEDSGNWDAGGGPITDQKFPDVEPPVPLNVVADGLFKKIALSWTFESTYIIAAYEVYASQINGFVPDPTNLVFRGKVGAFNFATDTDEKWYFRVRAVNTHGTPSDYSEQVSASTVQLALPDLEDIVPEFINYSIYEGDEPPNVNDYTYWLNTSEEPKLLYKWNETLEEWYALAPTNAADIEAVSENEYNEKISSIEETAEQISLSVSTLEREVDEHNISIEDNRSTIEQQANEIAQRVKATTYEADMSDMNIRVTHAESEIIQHADEILQRVEKNGVVSSINQSPEEIRINAERIAINGDLVVNDGKVYIKDGVITNNLIAGNANIDGAKIANASITNAKIANINADKINAGILDANKVLVRVKNGTQAIEINDNGFETVDNNGNIRIHIGVQNIGGKGQSNPATIRFFGGSGSVSAGVGMNVNNHFIIGSDQNGVSTSIYSDSNQLYYGQQHRFVAYGVTNPADFFQFSSVLNTGGTAREPYFRIPRDNVGYIGSPSFRWWRIYGHNVHANNFNEISSRDSKENIHTIDLEELQRVFNKIEIKRFNRKIGDKKTGIKVHTGIIAEDGPEELMNETQDGVLLGSAIFTVAGALKYQMQRIDNIEKKLEGAL
ncbi:phage tail protein [Virgibacillus salarius]|uniref:phage tail spike protein n=1 Tax=Virgibacillus salarius TaxID=447199 RepID=UPI002493A047|nr:phage tail spike protein [Virgibacillus salarius]WBX81094.1 phage tail protein [Virgibacillus salarius]